MLHRTFFRDTWHQLGLAVSIQEYSFFFFFFFKYKKKKKIFKKRSQQFTKLQDKHDNYPATIQATSDKKNLKSVHDFLSLHQQKLTFKSQNASCIPVPNKQLTARNTQLIPLTYTIFNLVLSYLQNCLKNVSWNHFQPAKVTTSFK